MAPATIDVGELEVHHPDAFFADKAEHVFPGEVPGLLLEEGDYLVGIESDVFVHYAVNWTVKIAKNRNNCYFCT